MVTIRVFWHRLRGHRAYRLLAGTGSCNTCDVDFT